MATWKIGIIHPTRRRLPQHLLDERRRDPFRRGEAGRVHTRIRIQYAPTHGPVVAAEIQVAAAQAEAFRLFQPSVTAREEHFERIAELRGERLSPDRPGPASAGSQRRRQRCAIARAPGRRRASPELRPETRPAADTRAIGSRRSRQVVAAGRFTSRSSDETTCAVIDWRRAGQLAQESLGASRQRGPRLRAGSVRREAAKRKVATRDRKSAVVGAASPPCDPGDGSCGGSSTRLARPPETTRTRSRRRHGSANSPGRLALLREGDSHQRTSAHGRGVRQASSSGRPGAAEYASHASPSRPSAGQPSETCGPVHTSADDGHGRCVGGRRANPDRSHQHRIEAKAPPRRQPVDRRRQRPRRDPCARWRRPPVPGGAAAGAPPIGARGRACPSRDRGGRRTHCCVVRSRTDAALRSRA